MIECKFICDHCGKTGNHSDVMGKILKGWTTKKNFEGVYLPKDWLNCGYGKHFCEKCRKKISKINKDFFKEKKK